MTGIGVIGFGYWGPNMARNFDINEDSRVAAVCDIDSERLELARHAYPLAKMCSDYNQLLESDEVDAVVIATPVSTHFEIAGAALDAGVDALVEKPIARTVAEAEALIKKAADKKLILCVDHTFVYTGAVRKIKEIIDSGALGRIMYIDSIRVNLGLFQRDVNVIHDLAPHDLSIACYLLDKDPISVQAIGAAHTSGGFEYLSYLYLEYEGGLSAHFNLNWLSPVKIRRTLIAGDRQMIVYDDMEPSEKVKIYDRGVTIKEGDRDSIYKMNVDYRVGDMVAPKLDTREALAVEVEHFLSCVASRAQPVTDGKAGLRVVRIIEAAQLSISNRGERVVMNGI